LKRRNTSAAKSEKAMFKGGKRLTDHWRCIRYLSVGLPQSSD
jgi:hypothetical protein